MLAVNVRLLFVHGWAFTPAFWEPLIRELADFPCQCLDLGFFGPERLDAPFEGDGPVTGAGAAPGAGDGHAVVGVGHSLGLLWLLRHGRVPLRGLVSLGGFSVFTAMEGAPCGVSSTAVKVMRRGLGRDHAAVLKTFHRNCGTPPELIPDFAKARPERLTEGLDWLLTWDERAALEPHGVTLPSQGRGDKGVVPLSALAARDDAIVPPALTSACFAGSASRLEWLPSGGHAFPLTRTTVCAGHIRRFLAGLTGPDGLAKSSDLTSPGAPR